MALVVWLVAAGGVLTVGGAVTGWIRLRLTARRGAVCSIEDGRALLAAAGDLAPCDRRTNPFGLVTVGGRLRHVLGERSTGMVVFAVTVAFGGLWDGLHLPASLGPSGSAPLDPWTHRVAVPFERAAVVVVMLAWIGTTAVSMRRVNLARQRGRTVDAAPSFAFVRGPDVGELTLLDGDGRPLWHADVDVYLPVTGTITLDRQPSGRLVGWVDDGIVGPWANVRPATHRSVRRPPRHGSARAHHRRELDRTTGSG